jgi:hypothetical protein
MSVLETKALVAVTLRGLPTELKAIRQRLGTALQGAHRQIQVGNFPVDGHRHRRDAPAARGIAPAHGVSGAGLPTVCQEALNWQF